MISLLQNPSFVFATRPSVKPTVLLYFSIINIRLIWTRRSKSLLKITGSGICGIYLEFIRNFKSELMRILFMEFIRDFFDINKDFN